MIICLRMMQQPLGSRNRLKTVADSRRCRQRQRQEKEDRRQCLSERKRGTFKGETHIDILFFDERIGTEKLCRRLELLRILYFRQLFFEKAFDNDFLF